MSMDFFNSKMDSKNSISLTLLEDPDYHYVTSTKDSKEEF